METVGMFEVFLLVSGVGIGLAILVGFLIELVRHFDRY